MEVLHSAVHLPKASARYLDWKARLPELQEGKALAGIRIRPTALPISHAVSPLGLTSGQKGGGGRGDLLRAATFYRRQG